MKFDKIAGIFFVILLLDFMLYIYKPFGDNFFIIANTDLVIFSLFAVISGFYAYKPHGFSSTQGKAILFITAGVFFWFLGELLWAFYEIVLGVEVPMGTVADVSYFVGYPLFMIGFYYIYRVASPSFTMKKKAILLAALAAIILPLTYISIPTLMGDMTIIEKISTAGYVIGDMLLLCSLLVAVSALWGGKFAKSWSIIFLGILLSAFADIYYMNLSLLYETGGLFDVLWDFSYLFMTLGFLYHRETLKNVMQSFKRETQAVQSPLKTAAKKPHK